MKKKPKRFSDQLRQAVEQSDQSRYAIHLATGIDESVLSKFVRGLRGLQMDTVDTLCEYLGLRLTADKTIKKKAN